jgi:sugar/nucleoside kinase (ribokinase family)
MDKRVSAAGNLIVDYVLGIAAYPGRGGLESVSAFKKSIGGCVPNTLTNLARMDGELSLSAYGRVGKDEGGGYVVGAMEREGIDVSGIIRSGAATSFTAVMSEVGGERTFFHYKGANADFCPNDVDVKKLDCEILHIGYLLLLDGFERSGALPEFLKTVRAQGIRTSADAAGGGSGRYKQIARPCLPHLDYLIVNETEAGQIAGIEPRKNGKIDKERVREILAYFITSGVGYAVIHCPEAGFSMRGKTFSVVPSLALPKEYIKGTVGAGDAFCAGVLYGALKGLSDCGILEYASLSAAANLSSEDSGGGARSYGEIVKLGQIFSRKENRYAG